MHCALRTNKTLDAALEENETKHELKRAKAELEELILTIKLLQRQLCSIRKDIFGKHMIGQDYEVESKNYLVMDHVAKYIALVLANTLAN